MKRVILVGCAQTKALPEVEGYPKPQLPAKDLYVSPLFKKRRAYAEREVAEGRAECWGILSALFKCVAPDRELPGYDWTMKDWRVGELDGWGEQVAVSLTRDVRQGQGFHDHTRWIVEIHAGASYVEAAETWLVRKGYVIETPLAGLGIGDQLRWYNLTLDPQLEIDFEEAA
jgi:hypothetical protein